jgi:lipopolysaccharide/colanic/teichoic acid biosynthesis glycosyltransferase
MRRGIDVVASGGALLVLSPALAVIAILIKRDSPGPVIFRQVRVGLHGRHFTLLKFRSMATRSDLGVEITAQGDSRVTTVGRRLRATKVDELPQLVNVLRGDMSLVGPRPEVAKYVAMWPEDQRRVILSVKPGLTDPVTLSLSNEESILAEHDDPEAFYRTVLLPAKAQGYVGYVQGRSLSGDACVLARTTVTLASLRAIKNRLPGRSR